MNAPVATQLRVATVLGVVMVTVGLALGLTGWGLTGMWVAVLVFTPLSVALETYVTRRRHPSRSRGEAASGEHRDALA